MLAWLKEQWSVLRSWMRANQDAHARAPTLPCCSSPPPGAGHTAGKEE